MNQESSFKKGKKNLHSLFLMLNSSAFTLAEILVVMAITAIVGTILVVIFTNTLRGSNKAQILAVIKQNGQSVLENMDKTIRNADSVVCRTDDTLVVIKEGAYTRFKVFVSTSSDNGSIRQDFPVQPQSVPKDVISVFLAAICTDPIGTDSTILPQVLTDTNPQTGVSVIKVKNSINNDLPFFVPDNLSGYKDSVTIQFALKPGVQAPSIITSQIDPVTFQTTIGLR